MAKYFQIVHVRDINTLLMYSIHQDGSNDIKCYFFKSKDDLQLLWSKWVVFVRTSSLPDTNVGVR